MLYKILNKYYIRTAPLIYTEIELSVKDGDILISPTTNKIEANGKTVATLIDFQKEKNNLMNEITSGQGASGNAPERVYSKRKRN